MTMTAEERYKAKQRRRHRDEEARKHADRLRQQASQPNRAEIVEKYAEEHQPAPRMVVDIATGKISRTTGNWWGFVDVPSERDLTAKQRSEMQVSLNDHSTPMGRLVTDARKAAREEVERLAAK